MTRSQPKRLLEELIPLAEISAESSKSVGKGDPRAIHTWFARRAPAACRAATFAALVDAPRTEEERDALQRLIIRSQANAPDARNPEFSQVIHEMRALIAKTYEGRTPRVLDPFAGGGSLPLEAARLGCEAHAIDLNPVALLTMLGTVDYPIRLAEARIPLPLSDDHPPTLEEAEQPTGNLVDAVRAWGNWVFEHVRGELAPFYPTEPDGSIVVAYLWAKTVHCTNPSCGGEIPLVAHRWLSRTKGKPSVAYRLVPQANRTLQVEILEGQNAEDDHPEQGTMARGSTQCLFCPQTLSPKEVKAQATAGHLGRMPLAVAYKPAGATGTRFRPAIPADQDTYQQAQRALAAAVAAHDDPFLPLVPDEPVSNSGGRWLNVFPYGVRTWGEMHDARQALALATFARGVRDAYHQMRAQGAAAEMAQAVALYLAFTLSRMVLRLSEASRWHNTGNKVESATGGHRLQMLWDYAEINPLSGASGSWVGLHDWALPSIERLMGAAQSVGIVRWGDAAQLPYSDEFFDAVLTDPPYYDSVGYSYLSDMQYVWLHRALQDVVAEYFPAPLTPKNAEIIEDKSQKRNSLGAKVYFEKRLQMALAEMRRVLKPDGIALVMYSHTATSAWEMLVGALIGAGFQVTASWPVDTETASRREWLGGVMLAASIFLVCRKRQGDRVGYLDEILPQMRDEVRRSLARFWAAGIGGADFFISAIGPALSVFSRYGEVRYSSGQVVSVANFLTLVRQAVVDFSLERALAGADVGEVDRESQFALLWRWTYGRQKVETGAALLLDKATGVELSELEKHGLLARVDGAKKMVLLGPAERKELLDKTLRRALAGHAPLVDVIHCAAILWRDNRRDELNELLAMQGDTMRKVAQALADLQPDSSDERRLILGFLGAWRITSGKRAPIGTEKQLPLELK